MNNRPFRTTVRFTNEEYADLKDQCDAAGLSLSQYIRARILGKRVVSKADLKILAELRRIGGLLKHIHLETRGAYSELTREAIQEITRYIRNFGREKSAKK